MTEKKSNNEAVRQVLEEFNKLNEWQKIQMLNRANVWYLKHKGALVAPMLEMQEMLSMLARLSWLCRRFYQLDQERKLNFNLELIKATSEQAIIDNVVKPVTEIIGGYIKEIESLIAEAKKAKEPKKEENAKENKEEKNEA